MQKNIIPVVAALMLVVGLGVGYGFGIKKGPDSLKGNNVNTHMMPDGSMMHDRDANAPMGMEGMMMAMNAELEDKTGDEFDRAFLSEMIVHHEGAVSMAQLALTNANHQEIKDLAAAIIEAQNKEIADMKAWNAAWYK